ncbi:MAG TPA: lipid-transfer protein [Acidimicrobiales bacterium]|nr:lipid-transfer protein [Acidimicrobiales bacterium]
MSVGITDATAIVGIAQTEFSKHLEPGEAELACQVIVDACADAGISPSEVDALCSYTMEATEEVDIARNIGCGDVTFFSQIGYGGGAGCGVVGHAAMAVATGQAEVAVGWRSRKRGSGPRPWTSTSVQLKVPGAWTRPFGMLRPVDEIAMLTRRYMHQYGATREHLANVAVAVRKHANRNPAAVMYSKPMTHEDYMAARWISEPLCLFDNCLETDGALACVVVSAERARDLRQPPVYIHAFAQGLPSQHQTMVNFFNDDPLSGPAWACARRLWRNAEFGPADVDVAQIYDAFTPLIPLSLEGYGFCERGEGAAFTEGGNLEWGKGTLPTNTSGGGLSEAYVHGFNLINEGVKQLRGTSTSQVEGAETCLVTSGEGVPTSALLLRK